jgi:hypothetical protein
VVSPTSTPRKLHRKISKLSGIFSDETSKKKQAKYGRKVVTKVFAQVPASPSRDRSCAGPASVGYSGRTPSCRASSVRTSTATNHPTLRYCTVLYYCTAYVQWCAATHATRTQHRKRRCDKSRIVDATVTSRNSPSASRCSSDPTTIVPLVLVRVRCRPVQV